MANMKSRMLSQTHNGERDQWLAGYAAAINDAVAIVDAFGGPSFHNFSAPVLVRLKTRLIELQNDGRAEAA